MEWLQIILAYPERYWPEGFSRYDVKAQRSNAVFCIAFAFTVLQQNNFGKKNDKHDRIMDRTSVHELVYVHFYLLTTNYYLLTTIYPLLVNVAFFIFRSNLHVTFIDITSDSLIRVKSTLNWVKFCSGKSQIDVCFLEQISTPNHPIHLPSLMN